MTRKAPTMLKCHFEYIADVLRSDRPESSRREALGAWVTMVLNMAHAFQGTNPRFDRDRFLRACGLES